MKTSLKTNLLILLFTVAFIESSAIKLVQMKPYENKLTNTEISILSGTISDYIFVGDTITTSNAEEKFEIPNRLLNKIIDFQINSDITYRSFRHFVRNDSKKTFFQAWLLDKELQKLSLKTDSLRKTYGSAGSDQKEVLAAEILKIEKRTIDLNLEIPVLYQNARKEENQYWKSATEDEIRQFQDKVKLFSDSINQFNLKAPEQAQPAIAQVPDTLYFEKEENKASPAKPELSSEISYKIQIAAYKGKIPDLANKLIKKLSAIRKVENYVDDKGVKVYTTGNLKNYNEAVTLLGQVKQEGVKNPVIAAYLKGKRIPVAEARKLNNEL